MTAPLEQQQQQQQQHDDDAENSPVVVVSDFIEYKQKDAALLSSSVSKKVIKYSQKRLAKSQSRELFTSSTRQNQHPIGTVEHSQLELGMMLGNGSFSAVYEIRSVRSSSSPSSSSSSSASSSSSPQHSMTTNTGTDEIIPERSVVKVLRTSLLSKPAMLAACAADLAKEGYIMASLRHRNILSVKAWPTTGLQGFGSGRHDAFFLVLDRLNETLSDRLVEWQKQSQRLKYIILQRASKKANFLQERLHVALQLADALEYLHNHNILHRDLKPDNIGFQLRGGQGKGGGDSAGLLKVFDFDVARILPKSVQRDEAFVLTKKAGSPRYMSPECARGDAYNLKSDVYSFSLLLHECLSMERPYDSIPSIDHDNFVFYRGIRPVVPESWPTTIQALLHSCWADDFTSRPTMAEVHRILQEEVVPLQSSSSAQTKGKKTSATRMLQRSFGKKARYFHKSVVKHNNREEDEEGNLEQGRTKASTKRSPSFDRLSCSRSSTELFIHQ